MAHFCHAVGCKVEVHRNMLMCYEHWSKVPKDLQSQVKKHYSPTQAMRGNRPSPSWLAAAKAAILAVKK